jgi:hypothetical protein
MNARLVTVHQLRRQIKTLLTLFIIGLVLSGLTAFPEHFALILTDSL